MYNLVFVSSILEAIDAEMVQSITDPYICELEESFDTMFEIILNGIKN